VSGGELDAMRDAMCACKDKACARKVDLDNSELVDRVQADVKAGKVPGDAFMKSAEDIAACRTKANSAH
jgi:hypothetical protein